ncbi:MAG: flotillin-like FloA family protein, partial [Myxococcota bacterium]
EAEVPKAMAQALIAGRLGVMDYYNMNNIIADTDMRKSLGTSSETEQPG